MSNSFKSFRQHNRVTIAQLPVFRQTLYVARQNLGCQILNPDFKSVLSNLSFCNNQYLSNSSSWFNSKSNR